MGASEVVVSGFEPFGGQAINASWEAVSLLPDEISGHPVRKLRVPVEFGRSGDLVESAVRELVGGEGDGPGTAPALVLAVGEAGGRARLTVERVALNVEDARIPDNAGFQPHEQPVVEGGPDAYLARLPLARCVEAAREELVPTEISNTAGLYVCNQLMYRIIHDLEKINLDTPAGFVHVPYTPQQVITGKSYPSMPSELASRGLLAMIGAILEYSSEERC